MKRTLVLCVLALAVCALPAAADTLFSDFGPGNSYNCCTGWTISGTGTIGTSFTSANSFTAAGSGNFNVSQIDLAVGYVTGLNSFYASIWTDNGGLPGSMVPGALWQNLSSSTNFGGCCGVVTISGISGVSLTGGDSYFMILGPMNINDTTWEAWNWNDQGATGLDLYSTDGGQNWNSNGVTTIGAFDIIGAPGGVPEPASLFLLGSGLVGAIGTLRRKLNR